MKNKRNNIYDKLFFAVIFLSVTLTRFVDMSSLTITILSVVYVIILLVLWRKSNDLREKENKLASKNK